MDNYYTIDEKYLQAVDELYGEPALCLKLLKEILAEDPLYIRAHYQLGMLYYYDLLDYQSAGYHFKLCTGIGPSFPDVYFHYVQLLVFLNMERQVNLVIQKAVTVPGVNTSAIYNLAGLCAENNRKWNQSRGFYHKALLLVTSKDEKLEIEENMERVKFKMEKKQGCNLHLNLTYCLK